MGRSLALSWSWFALLSCLVVLCMPSVPVAFAGLPTYKLDPTFLPAATLLRANITNTPSAAVDVSQLNGKGRFEYHIINRNPASDPIFVVDEQGNWLRSYGRADIVIPHSIDIEYGPGGPFIWCGDMVNHTAVKFHAPSGAFVLRLGTPGVQGEGLVPHVQFDVPTCFAWDAAGYLYIGDGYGPNCRVIKFDPFNAYAVIWATGGCAGPDINAPPALFENPHSMSFDLATNTLWVADRGNQRIKVYNTAGSNPPQLLAMWRTPCVHMPWSIVWMGPVLFVAGTYQDDFVSPDSEWSIFTSGADLSCVQLQITNLTGTHWAHGIAVNNITAEVIINNSAVGQFRSFVQRWKPVTANDNVRH